MKVGDKVKVLVCPDPHLWPPVGAEVIVVKVVTIAPTGPYPITAEDPDGTWWLYAKKELEAAP